MSPQPPSCRSKRLAPELLGTRSRLGLYPPVRRTVLQALTYFVTTSLKRYPMRQRDLPSECGWTRRMWTQTVGSSENTYLMEMQEYCIRRKMPDPVSHQNLNQATKTRPSPGLGSRT